MRLGEDRSMTPYPRRSVPGSMPRMRTLGDALQRGLVDVQVRVDVLDVVVVLEQPEELERRLRLLAGEVHRVLRDHGHLRRGGRGPPRPCQAAAGALEL